MNEKINLQDIVNLFSQKQGIGKKEADLIVRTMFDLIEEALKTENYVKIKGFGTFKLTEVDARESVNVNTGERFEIQGHSKISFTPDTTMKDLINKPFAHFETVILNDGVELEDTPTEIVADVPEAVVEMPTATEEPTIEEVSMPEVSEKPIVAEEPMVMEEKPMETEETPVVEETVEEIVKEEETAEPIAEEPTIAEPVVEEETITEPVTESIPEEKPVIIEEKPLVAETKTETKEKNINRILWGVIVVLVLIILFGAYWMFLRPTDASEAPSMPPVQEEVVIPTPVTEEETTKEDTLKTVQFIELSEEELRKERVPSLADTLEYQIIGTETEYTLKNGETIIRASVKFFGTKKYWPYIVKHNMDILPNPDNIPAGVQLKIPKLVEKP